VIRVDRGYISEVIKFTDVLDFISTYVAFVLLFQITQKQILGELRI